MPLPAETINELAASLYRAERTRTPIAPLTETYPDMEIGDAYAVQLEGVRLRIADGAKISGWKVGLTSRAMRQMFNVDQPDFGHLFVTMLLDASREMDSSQFIWPRVEPEVGFQLKAGLRGPGVSAADVLAATECLIPALELIDSRVRDWKIKLCDTIADNASCGRYVLGAGRTPPAGIDVKLIGMNYYVNDELVSTATSAAVIGDPAAAIAWLCNTIAPYGQGLEAGQVVIPGSLVAAVDAKPGSRIRADFAHLGSVELRVR